MIRGALSACQPKLIWAWCETTQAAVFCRITSGSVKEAIAKLQYTRNPYVPSPASETHCHFLASIQRFSYYYLTSEDLKLPSREIVLSLFIASQILNLPYGYRRALVNLAVIRLVAPHVKGASSAAWATAERMIAGNSGVGRVGTHRKRLCISGF